MLAIITGDVVNSRKDETGNWLRSLKIALTRYGNEPRDWEIYRGDSFQLKVEPKNILEAIIYIKANLKVYKDVDVRLGIGIGEAVLRDKITESNGMAFHRSGEAFDKKVYRKKKNIYLESGNEKQNELLNSTLILVSLLISTWTSSTCRIVIEAINKGEVKQSDIAKELGITQSAISQSYRKSGWEDIKEVLELFPKLVE